MSHEKLSSSTASRSDAPLDQDTPLVERYWADLRRGEDADPKDWLESRATKTPDLLDQLTVLRLIHESRLGLKRPNDNPGPPEVAATPKEPTATVQQVLPDGTTLDGGVICILGLLGRGGMGEVYRAWHHGIDDSVAIKLTKNPTMQERFRREIAIHHRLCGHPNIVLAKGLGHHEGYDYLELEYVSGVNLQQFVETNGPLPWREACEVVRQTAMGLKHAHGKQVVHRDIKPSNLIRSTEDRCIKILDWGLARCTDVTAPGGDRALTQADCRVGTPGYMSPEQVFSPERVGPASDLYNLGCTFYCLLGGRPPFDGLPDRRWRPPALPKELEVPLPVEQVVLTLLRYEPTDRYCSAQDVVEALDVVLESPIHSVPRRRNWFVAGVLLLAAIILGAAVGPRMLIGPKVSPKFTSPVAQSPRLENLELTVIRDKKERESYTLTPSERRVVATPTTLGPSDPFVLTGRFGAPTNWYVLWIDTLGGVKVEARSQTAMTELRYPESRDPQHPVVALPDPKNPLGTHLLLLVAAHTRGESDSTLLEDRLRGIGKPPTLRGNEPWHRSLVVPINGDIRSGTTEVMGGDVQLPQDYLAIVQKRLEGTPLQALHAIFLNTGR